MWVQSKAKPQKETSRREGQIIAEILAGWCDSIKLSAVNGFRDISYISSVIRRPHESYASPLPLSHPEECINHPRNSFHPHSVRVDNHHSICIWFSRTAKGHQRQSNQSSRSEGRWEVTRKVRFLKKREQRKPYSEEQCPFLGPT